MSKYKNYIKNHPIESNSIMLNFDVETFKKFIKNRENLIKLLHDLISNNQPFPVDYYEALIDGRISEKDFKTIVSEGHLHWTGVAHSWPDIAFLLKLHEEMGNKDFKKTVQTLEKNQSNIGMIFSYKLGFDFDADGKIANSEHEISAKRLVELLNKPDVDSDIVPLLDMTASEALYVYGKPSTSKEDVMKTKTVETWVYKATSKKQERQIKSLELKFENNLLTRYIDNRDETYYGVCNLEDNYRKTYPTMSESSPSLIEIFDSLDYINSLNSDEETIDSDLKKSYNDLLVKIIPALTKVITKMQEEIDVWKKYKFKGGPSSQRCLRLGEEHQTTRAKLNELVSPNDELNDLISTFKETHNICINIGNNTYGSSGCFIATATMGSYNNPIVKDLRIFRDTFLQKSYFGREFIKIYYKFGPYPAKLIAKSLILRKISYFLIIRPLYFVTNLLVKR